MGPVQPRVASRGGEHAALGGAPGVDRFAHGPLEPGLPQAGGLRAGVAERPRALVGVEPEERAGRGGRAEDPGGRGDVPEPVVVVAEGSADADRRLVAVQQRFAQCRAGGARRLGDGEGGGHDDVAGMDPGVAVHVVELEQDAEPAVDECGRRLVGATAGQQHAGAVGGAAAPGMGAEHPSLVARRTESGDRRPVEDPQRSGVEVVGGDGAGGEQGDELGGQALAGGRCGGGRHSGSFPVACGGWICDIRLPTRAWGGASTDPEETPRRFGDAVRERSETRRGA